MKESWRPGGFAPRVPVPPKIGPLGKIEIRPAPSPAPKQEERR